ncbi:MAG: ComEC/Rec2 family competence protein [Candidatus Pacebacteria bacterium]|nr:ComEC/Rec2 family competence protein [Candidatus Paceibacterota bacterium]
MSKKEIILIFILIIIALVRFFFFIPKAPNFDEVLNKKVEVEGLVIAPPDIRQTTQRVLIKPNNQETNILVVISRNIDISYGDLLKIRGFLESPENFITDVGKEFNYKRYLANQDVYFIIKNAVVDTVSKNNGNKIKTGLYKLRDNFIKNIEKTISPPNSDLANGLLLGTRGGFDNEIKDNFIKTGTIHIVALSGYNVTIIAEGVMKFFGLIFSKTISVFFGIFIIFLFILMTGAQATAVRAGIMATILIFGRLTGRTYDAGRALVIAGLLMIAYDPRTITDISFQLSFIATAGILFVTPKVLIWFRFLPNYFKIRDLIATTTAATISVLPILLYTTGIFSIVSLPANILILPVIPLAMLFSFLTSVLGFISSFFALPFGYLAHLILSYVFSVINFFANFSFSSVGIKSFPLIITILLYLFLSWWVSKNKK